ARQRTMRAALGPLIDSTKAVGVVSLPGAMTGMILAGVSPLQAARLQIVVMFMLLAATSVSVLLAVELGTARLLNARGQLIAVPPFVFVTIVAVFYAKFEGLAWVHSVFLCVGPAMLAIVAIAAYKLARSTNKHDPDLWAIAAVVCALTAITGAQIVWLFIAAG